MIHGPTDVQLSPPLGVAWRKNTAFSMAVAGNDSLYGVSPAGKLVALHGADGSVRWEAQATYITHGLVRQGSRLFAYRVGEGFGYIDDNGTSASERLALSFGASDAVNMSSPVVDDRMVYLAINRGLHATHQDEGLQYTAILDDVMPYTVGLIASGQIVVIDGKGVPSKYRATSTTFELVWRGAPHNVDVGQAERPFVIVDDRLILGIGTDTVAYDLTTGSIAWRLVNVPARAFAIQNSTVYAAFHGASLWAIRSSDGGVLWQRQYVYDIGLQREYGLALSGNTLYFGGALQTNPDGAILLATRAMDGAFVWLARPAVGAATSGIPVSDGSRLFCYGAGHTGAFSPLARAPGMAPEQVTATPSPLRGRSTDFGQGRVQVNMGVAGKVSISAYRERTGLGTRIITDANWAVGPHEVSWNVTGAGGYTDESQFGYILVDVTETGGLSYTQTQILPINTFPDILWHWARNSIEIMVYHKFVSGYPDQTFKPDGLVTRAESSIIIAKTLNLEGPGAEFQTKFTDISAHWARNYIMALEERGVISGFAEPDGTYTFRPNLNMTRAQEARILVGAYTIPPAPPSFVSKFTDIAGHWAEPDVRALEAAGYVNGFQEPNGTFTYRPEQNLTRAELCTVVVRIRGLSR